MTKILPLPERVQSLGEEIANSISHGVGFVMAVAASPILIIAAAQRDSVAGIVGAGVFAFTIILLYMTSSLYHSLPRNKAKHIFHVLDHSAIFLLIAGTYTPFTLGILRGAWGWTLFGLVWGIAVVGVLIKIVWGFRYKKLSTILYLVMGWLIIIAVKPLWLNMPSQGLLWLIAGGVFYTVGTGFYAAKQIPFAHSIWHMFVMVGTACHFMAVFRYAV